jgi:hypothetical protein
MSWIPGTKRQSWMGSLGQLLREPPGSICSGAKPAIGKMLPLALVNVPVQFRSDLWVL